MDEFDGLRIGYQNQAAGGHVKCYTGAWCGELMSRVGCAGVSRPAFEVITPRITTPRRHFTP